jgi:hypothetical protein
VSISNSTFCISPSDIDQTDTTHDTLFPIFFLKYLVQDYSFDVFPVKNNNLFKYSVSFNWILKP